MKINELTSSNKNAPESNLVTALELIRNRYKDKNKIPKIGTQSLINLVLNTDKNFDYDALVAANDNNPAVKNLIKSFNQDDIELHSADSAGSDDTVSNPPEGDATTAPVDTVDDMAKRAAKQRGAPLF